MKTRWTAVALLLLVPLTMAPKIALVPPPDDPAELQLQVTALVPRTNVRAGTAVTTVFRTQNLSDAPLLVSLGIDVLLDGEPSRTIGILGLPRSCEWADDTRSGAICHLGEIGPGQAKTLRITARPTSTGRMSFEVAPTVLNGSSGNEIDANDVSIRVQ